MKVTKKTKLGHVIKIETNEEDWSRHSIRFDPLVPDEEIEDTLIEIDNNYYDNEVCIGTCWRNDTAVRIKRLATVTVASITFCHFC
jgi:hypothetical protein